MERATVQGVTLTTRLKEQARELGFSLVGVATVEPSDHLDFYHRWVEDGRHGEMAYLAREDAVSRRADIRRTMPSIRSAVVVGHDYFQEDPLGVPADRSRGVISRYARGQDYHGTIKKLLLELHRWIEASVDGPVERRVYVDTGPILEREMALRAGVGWFGKNTMLIHPKRGSYFFLGLLLLDLELDADAPFQEDHCGTCRSCLDACPTGALLGRDASGAPVMDAPRCISYLTIEHRGPIPTELRTLMGNRVYGCDICQEVCPFSRKFSKPSEESAYSPRPELNGPPLVELAERLLSSTGAGVPSYVRGLSGAQGGAEGFAPQRVRGFGQLGVAVGGACTRQGVGGSGLTRARTRRMGTGGGELPGGHLIALREGSG